MLKNQRYEKGRTSTDTSVFIAVFIDGKQVDQSLLDFGQILQGDGKTLKTPAMKGFQFGKEETVVAVVLEGWRYTPESTKNIGEITIVSGIAERLIVDATTAAVTYCKQNAGQCIKVVAGIFGTRLLLSV